VRDLIPAAGVGLLMSISLQIGLGFLARSTRDVLMAGGGFALGLVAAFLVDWAHRRRRVPVQAAPAARQDEQDSPA